MSDHCRRRIRAIHFIVPILAKYGTGEDPPLYFSMTSNVINIRTSFVGSIFLTFPDLVPEVNLSRISLELLQGFLYLSSQLLLVTSSVGGSVHCGHQRIGHSREANGSLFSVYSIFYSIFYLLSYSILSNLLYKLLDFQVYDFIVAKLC